ncbi:prephenate dehydrogenase [Desulfitobacterium dichloroeliminans LMG P-21439]|uniref:Prephenate dehydrogenase n=1 Tax=Desulfitobacterium dichloroeliminans (strain LMG P-21439 / DCA1) TaxID=871963 RepID=L0F986_DESDL|nr:prephenate dehydrogenase/arogenate dehydrogenase family protein [Desulfitobacterium dichloroeliminans]AGA69772.1 prephenate dehydrogenase [Desulfitobacterium dichloroeliminans LMG P-21439]
MEKMQKPVLSKGWTGERKPRACIIGLGLIGGSWAGALTGKGWSVSAVECDGESLEAAKSREWILEGWPSLPENLDVDLIILATPITLLAGTVTEIRGRIPAGSLITDVGSIKREICQATENLESVYFIGGHPMAGSEQRGFRYSSPDLFNGYPYVLTPHQDCPQELVNQFSSLVQSLGARVIFREYEEHDHEVALVSHVPHLLSLALALAASEGFPEGKPLELAGRSFREITRLVDSSPEMWREILLRNASAILYSLDIWEEKLKEIRGVIEHSNGEEIIRVFERAQGARGRVLNRR